MNEAIITGLFSLVGALIGAFVSLFIYSKTMKKNIQLEIQKISFQKEADLSIRLFDKQEAYMAELNVVDVHPKRVKKANGFSCLYFRNWYARLAQSANRLWHLAVFWLDGEDCSQACISIPSRFMKLRF